MASQTVELARNAPASLTRQEFGAVEKRRPAEVAAHAVAAREQALVQARFIMAERNPRNWDTVRVRLLSHCDRAGFAEVARYRKPVGKKLVNGEWKEQFAEGLSVRFAEIARQEMGNTDTESAVVYEDDLIRIVKAWVADTERNNVEAREIALAKTVEKRGRQNKKTSEWEQPEGREVISVRLNSQGEPTFLVKATDDELRNKQNAEISKVHRDCSLRLVPKDIRDEAEARILATLADPKKVDPAAARKRVIDSFAKIGVLPDDLMNYIGGPLERCSPGQLDELRGLWSAIHDGETTFNEALRTKYEGAQTDEETPAQHDARLQRQMKTQAQVAKERMDELAAEGVEVPQEVTDEENRRLDHELAAEETQPQAQRRAWGKR